MNDAESEPEEAAPVAPPEKGDPESFALRGRPRPAVRFRRGVIVGAAVAVVTALAGVTWLALAPTHLHMIADDDAEAAPARTALPDALAGAPGSYGDVPRLGRPLPGDLGGPILEHERNLDDPDAAAATGDAAAWQAAIEAERQRRSAERHAARSAPLLVEVSASGAREAGSVAQREAAGTASAGDADAQERDPRQTALRAPPSAWTLAAGTVIPASLVTGLDSDVPGIVIAQVTENVRDSATGRVVLVPQGARLIGGYGDAVAFGQRRALLVWRRLVLPDGASIALDDLPATDPAGYAGVEDAVDFHTGRLLEGIALSTLLGVGTELGLGGDENHLVRALREAAQRSAADAGDRITARNLDIRPTITVRPGWPVRAIVNKDLVLKPWRN